jgi:translation initiation factor IF-3
VNGSGGLLRRRRSARHDTKELHISESRINERIRVPEVRLVGPNGEQVGIVRVEDALRLAQEADLDLVEVAPDARPPVCKLMDYGKFKYEADMKAREARRNQANTVLKEIRFRLKIDPHDYGTKRGHVERFLKAGDKVKVMIMFRGREQSRPEMGLRLLQRLADDVVELGFVESAPRQDGRNMIMVLGPTKKKADVKHIQRHRDVKREAVATADEAVSTDRAPEAAQVAPQAAPAVETESAAPAASAAVESAVSAEVKSAVSAPVVSAPVESAAPAPAAPAAKTGPAARVGPAAKAAPATKVGSVTRAAPATKVAQTVEAEQPRASVPAPKPAVKSAPKAPSSATPRPAAPRASVAAQLGTAGGAPKPGAPKPAPPKPAVVAKPVRAARPASSAAPRTSTRKSPPGGKPESS